MNDEKQALERLDEEAIAHTRNLLYVLANFAASQMASHRQPYTTAQAAAAIMSRLQDISTDREWLGNLALSIEDEFRREVKKVVNEPQS